MTALQLLEKMGNNTALSSSDIASANISSDVRQALLSKDKQALEVAMRVRTGIFCSVNEPDEDDDSKKRNIHLSVNY